MASETGEEPPEARETDPLLSSDTGTGDSSPDPSKSPLPVFLWLFLFISSSLTSASGALVQPILDLLRETFDVTVKDAGLIALSLALGSVLGLVVVSPIGDLVDKRRVVISTVALVGIANVILGSVSSFYAFIAANFVLGILSGTLNLIAPMALELTPGEHRGTVIGSLVSGAMVGILLARVFAGFVADTLGYRAVFLIAAGVNETLAVAMVLVLPSVPPKKRAGDLKENVSWSKAYLDLLLSFGTLLTSSPVVIEACAMGFFTFVAFGNFWVSSTFLLAGAPYNFSPSTIGMLGFAGMAGIFTTPLLGYFSDRIPRHRFLIFGTTLSLVVWTALLLAGQRSAVVVFACAFFLDIATLSVTLVNRATILKLLSHAMARVDALYGLFRSLAQSLGTAAGPFAYAYFGWHGPAINYRDFVIILNLALLCGTMSDREDSAFEESDNLQKPAIRDAKATDAVPPVANGANSHWGSASNTDKKSPMYYAKGFVRLFFTKKFGLHRIVGLAFLIQYIATLYLALSDFEGSYRNSWLRTTLPLTGVLQTLTAIFTFTFLPRKDDGGYVNDVGSISYQFVCENLFFVMLVCFQMMYLQESYYSNIKKYLWPVEYAFVFLPYYWRVLFPITRFRTARAGLKESRSTFKFYLIMNWITKNFYLFGKHVIGFHLNYLRFANTMTPQDIKGAVLLDISGHFSTTIAIFLHTLRFKGYLPGWLAYSIYACSFVTAGVAFLVNWRSWFLYQPYIVLITIGGMMTNRVPQSNRYFDLYQILVMAAFHWGFVKGSGTWSEVGGLVVQFFSWILQDGVKGGNWIGMAGLLGNRIKDVLAVMAANPSGLAGKVW
ncbi:MFS general substrate transporter [Gonapodya prolifera JEL478]|uniref:MFS general substrate transporter n=1 Tax=Gonapodya prolifera (strain JEL478) TaxID=1344416 RepID=A0A139AYH5_GONPJ|nr:MFS general substrate transporter [Gonapodya prolifera JEL478]|eukprot:KXS21802.1 MFS general substrate transporter [Gonapodya prolifera JEL478]